ncbi:MAG: M20/M25/M40 family metallo-hydrolase [Lutisporaceae bacterium]
MDAERLINEFLEMVQITSLSLKEKTFADYLSGKLINMGIEVYIDKAGEKCDGNTGNIIARLKGNTEAPTIMLGAHMDTVVPGDNIKPQIKNGYIYSDGTTILGSDDKAGIAAILEAIRYINENNIKHGDIELVFFISEEGGMFGSKHLDYSKINSKLAFILDSSGSVGNVIIQGPAQMRIEATINGKAAHAGIAPEEGINAIQVASRAIDNMNLLRIDHETTANVGIIKGGSATNIVCDSVYTRFEARSLNNDKLKAQSDHMIECINTACKEYNTTCDLKATLNYPAFAIDKNSDIAKLVTKAIESIGQKANLISSGGGSDTNILNGNGIAAVTLAIGMNNVHTTSENIAIESIVKSAELVVAIIKNQVQNS